jgi:hypothetical protein
MDNLYNQLFLNISNKQKLFDLLNKGTKPDTTILNSYLDTCSVYNKDKCDMNITQKLIHSGAKVELNTIYSATLRLGNDIDHLNLILDNYKDRNLDENILDMACFVDDKYKYNLVKNLLDRYKIRPTNKSLLKCVKHHNQIQNTELKDEEFEFNNYFYDVYKLYNK